MPVMLPDWFLPLEFDLAWEAFLKLPRHPAYQYEYRAGRVRLESRPRLFHALLDLSGETTLTESSGLAARPVAAKDWPALRFVFVRAFGRTAPLRHLDDLTRRQATEQLLDATRSGRDGPLIPSASLVHCDDQNSPAGACLITLLPAGDLSDFTDPNWTAPPPNAPGSGQGLPHLTWIFVDPARQRRGLGAALLHQASAELRKLGYSRLASTFLLGDHASALWHWRQGFQLVSHPGSPSRLKSE